MKKLLLLALIVGITVGANAQQHKKHKSSHLSKKSYKYNDKKVSGVTHYKGHKFKTKKINSKKTKSKKDTTTVEKKHIKKVKKHHCKTFVSNFDIAIKTGIGATPEVITETCHSDYVIKNVTAFAYMFGGKIIYSKPKGLNPYIDYSYVFNSFNIDGTTKEKSCNCGVSDGSYYKNYHTIEVGSYFYKIMYMGMGFTIVKMNPNTYSYYENHFSMEFGFKLKRIDMGAQVDINDFSTFLFTLGYHFKN